MTTFEIEYRDPETDELVTVYREFEDTETITAREWAEDYAYTVADKGWYRVKQLPKG